MRYTSKENYGGIKVTVLYATKHLDDKTLLKIADAIGAYKVIKDSEGFNYCFLENKEGL